MTRFFSLTLVVILANYVPILAQQKDTPKNFTNGIGMKFVWIPPGSFLMGSPKSETGRETYYSTDETQHKVTLTKGFYMGVFPVSQREWGEVRGKDFS